MIYMSESRWVPWEYRIRMPTSALRGFPTAHVGDTSLIPSPGRCLQKEMATHSSILAWKNPKDRGAWWASIHGITKSWDTSERLNINSALGTGEV